jgi:hypothetical protein
VQARDRAARVVGRPGRRHRRGRLRRTSIAAGGVSLRLLEHRPCPGGEALAGGSSTPARPATRAAADDTRAPAPASASRAASRRSRRCCSTARKRRVSNRARSTSARSSSRARRNRAKSPWGSSTTWTNCSCVMPTRRASSSLASCTPDQRAVHSSDSSAGRSGATRTLTVPLSAVVPVPRALGRRWSGVRTTCTARPPTVAHSSTEVRTPSGAWSLRSCLSPREPGTRPNNAYPTASSRLVLPAPVAPHSRNGPASLTASRSSSTVPGNGPKAVTRRPVRPHQAAPSAAAPPSRSDGA